MLTWALICIVAMLHSAKRTQTFPLYSGMSLAPPAELIQKLVAEEEGEQTELEDRRHVKFQLGPNSDPWAKAKNSLQQENISNMVEDLKTAMLKLAPVDSLRNQGFFRQSPPKTTKRACFWKYCVTN
uniref:Urotensin-related peptide 1 n=1 Tax=Paramormyrops kingsleyae TaxID=1676925 RepID=A0A3B3QCG2_9TELE